jgi:hypothetical protein
LDPGYSNENYMGSWRILMRSSLNNFYPIDPIPRGQDYPQSAVAPQLLAAPFSTSLSKPSIEGTIEVEVPYYNLTHITPALTAPQTRARVEQSNYPTPVVSFIPRNSIAVPAANTLDPLLFRACADDFRFLYMLGPPQVSLLADSSSVTPIQNEPVKYTTSSVINNGAGNFAGLFGLVNFNVPTTSPGFQFKPPTQFIAANATGDRIWLLPSNLPYGFYNNPAQNIILNINASYWTGGTNLRFLTGVPNFTFAATNLAPSMYVSPDTILPAVVTTAQATPVPCLTWKAVATAMAANLSAITIPGQGIITFGQPTTTLIRFLVFQASGDVTPTFLNAVLINVGATVQFELETPQGASLNRYISVTDLNGGPIGLIPINLTGNVGFPVNQNVPVLTNAVANVT